MINQTDTMQVIADHLSGKYTQWDQFGVYFIAVILIGVMVFILVKTFFDFTIDRQETSETFEGRLQALFERINPHIGSIMLVVGILATVYGIYLILK